MLDSVLIKPIINQALGSLILAKNKSGKQGGGARIQAVV